MRLSHFLHFLRPVLLRFSVPGDISSELTMRTFLKWLDKRTSRALTLISFRRILANVQSRLPRETRGVRATPTALVVDSDGKIVKITEGTMDAEREKASFRTLHLLDS